MGDRASVQFVKDDVKSVVLFSCCQGTGLRDKAEKYIMSLPNDTTPLGRHEAQTVMLDFIRHLTKNMDRVDHDLYLGKDESDGDTWSKHFVIHLDAPIYLAPTLNNEKKCVKCGGTFELTEENKKDAMPHKCSCGGVVWVCPTCQEAIENEAWYGHKPPFNEVEP